MTERIRLDDLTSDQYDALHHRLEHAEAECERLRARLGSALASIRLLRLYATQLDHGHKVAASDVARRIRRIVTGIDDREPAPDQPAEPDRLAHTGIHTPGCTCGHQHMGISWHSDDCPWRQQQLDPRAVAHDLTTALRERRSAPEPATPIIDRPFRTHRQAKEQP